MQNPTSLNRQNVHRKYRCKNDEVVRQTSLNLKYHVYSLMGARCWLILQVEHYLEKY